MKFYFWFLALSMALISCKKNSQQLTPEQQQAKLQEQLDSIANIKFTEIVKEDVDTYPIFKGVCDSATTKAGQKECFEKTFAALFQERLKKDPLKMRCALIFRYFQTTMLSSLLLKTDKT